MSFFNSLNRLWLKLEQKNIVLCSGNINEIIDNSCEGYRTNFEYLINGEEHEFISVIEHICSLAKFLNFKVIKYFSPNLGIVDYLNKNNYENTPPEDDEDEFLDDESGNTSMTLNHFIEEINKRIKNIREGDRVNYKDLYILECGEIFLNNNNGIDVNKLASFIESFIEFSKQPTNNFHRNKIKLLILARSPDSINQFTIRNNVEFSSTTLLKPDKNERESFFINFKHKFTCLSDTCKEVGHPDYNELITLTDGMSFREIFQYSKIDSTVVDQITTFKQLYQLISFNKKESEWEKIDFKKMKEIDNILAKRVKGQEFAVKIVKKTLIRSFTGMNGVLHSTTNNKKPKGTLFLVGPTGTGKTELAKAISDFVFGDENRIIRFDMSEFNQEHSDQRLIGAPPGYVGYDSGGELTNAVKEKPFSILLFDEIEKAHNKILDKFLQILEDGRLTSSKGEVIDFSETFIIFTSNIGVSQIQDNFDDTKYVREHFIKSVSEYFNNELNRPEILNRIGVKNIVPFNFITDERIIKSIIDSKINKLKELLEKEKYINIQFKNNAQEKIEDSVIRSVSKKLGGRGIITELETKFIDRLSEFIFNNFKIIKENKDQNKMTKIDVIFENELDFNIS